MLSTPSILDHPPSPMDTSDLGFSPHSAGLDFGDPALDSMDWLDISMVGGGVGGGSGVREQEGVRTCSCTGSPVCSHAHWNSGSHVQAVFVSCTYRLNAVPLGVGGAYANTHTPPHACLTLTDAGAIKGSVVLVLRTSQSCPACVGPVNNRQLNVLHLSSRVSVMTRAPSGGGSLRWCGGHHGQLLKRDTPLRKELIQVETEN
ncbi:hypothetical protein WMY93_010172 [Mugilogobius chulae]|uniref:Uncharacterized protein n=1 Tax=Mugilogobius chulae TaxID=88201 RepID=A0AAW0PJ10_9GOBI